MIMEPNWSDNRPIYRQLRDRVVAMILEDTLKEGDPLPVLKGYQSLVDEGLVEKRRGLGMFVREGARRNLMKNEREQFLKNEWPQILQRIQRLGLELQELAKAEHDARVKKP